MSDSTFLAGIKDEVKRKQIQNILNKCRCKYCGKPIKLFFEVMEKEVIRKTIDFASRTYTEDDRCALDEDDRQHHMYSYCDDEECPEMPICMDLMSHTGKVTEDEAQTLCDYILETFNEE